MVNKNRVTASTSHKPHHSFRALFGQPAGHGPVYTAENQAVIIPQGKAGDNNTYSFLQLAGIGGGGIRGERLSDIQKQGYQAPQARQKNMVVRASSQINRHFHICATSTFVPQTFQQPQQPAPATREYILTIRETQMPSS